MSQPLREGDPHRRVEDVVPERLRPRNSFADFVAENQRTFGEFSALDHDLRIEEEEWIGSLSFTQLANQLMDVVNEVQVNNVVQIGTRRKERSFDWGREHIRRAVFGTKRTVGLDDLGIDVEFYRKRMKPDQTSLFQHIAGQLREFSDNYHEAVGDITTVFRTTDGVLREKLIEYIQGNPISHLFDIATFLTSPQYASDREFILPFLKKLAENETPAKNERRESVLDMLSHKSQLHIEQEAKAPQEAAFVDFLKSSVSPKDRFFDWIRAITAAMGKDFDEHTPIDDEHAQALYGIFIQSGFPQDLLLSYKSDLLRRVSLAMQTVRNEIGKYRQRSENPPVEVFPGLGPRPDMRLISKGKEEPKPASTGEILSPEPYLLGRAVTDIDGHVAHRILLLTEEEMRLYMQNVAGKLSKNNGHMFADIETMIGEMQKEPRGYGTEKLTAQYMTVDGVPLALRSFNAGKRVSTKLQDPLSTHLRVVYAIRNKHGDKPGVILLEGVYVHDEYTKKFG